MSANANKRKLFYILLLAALTMFLIIINQTKWLYIKKFTRIEKLIDANSNKASNHQNHRKGFLVYSSECRIPDIDPWDKEVKKFVEKPKLVNCSKEFKNWSHMKKNMLVMDLEAIKRDGCLVQAKKEKKKTSKHSKKSTTPKSTTTTQHPLVTNEMCCYKVIHRGKRSTRVIEKMLADNSVLYSDCIPIDATKTKISAEFIMVECSCTKSASKIVYKGFHAVASTNENEREQTIKEKLNFWKEKLETGAELPPNILIIGHDSTSRLNYRRKMPKTVKILQEMDAVEMRGYTKLGENTTPNFIALLTGYNLEDYLKICKAKRGYQDGCPLIWKAFDRAKYITAHIEDSLNTAFNYMKFGFKNQPVDFYIRPFFLAVSKHNFKQKGATKEYCVGSQTYDELLVKYLESTLSYAEENKMPIFSMLWSSYLAHDNFNRLELADSIYASLLKRLFPKNSKKVDNNIILVMGDHGFRYGKIAKTQIGQYENKLPNMWIRLPPRIQSKFPHWHQALKANSERLTSPYHFYHTLNHILQIFSGAPKPKDIVAMENGTQKIVARKFNQQHFLFPVPQNNSCEAVGIPEEFCACHSTENVSLKDVILKQASVKAIEKINSDFKTLNATGLCAKMSIKKITKGGVIKKQDGKVLRYVVDFLANPGNVDVRGQLNYFPGNKTFQNQISVQRTNKINKKYTKCLLGREHLLEMYCYCKNTD